MEGFNNNLIRVAEPATAYYYEGVPVIMNRNPSSTLYYNTTYIDGVINVPDSYALTNRTLYNYEDWSHNPPHAWR